MNVPLRDSDMLPQDPAMSRDELTDNDMLAVSGVILQNKIRMLATGVSDDGFDAEEAEVETLERLHELFEQLSWVAMGLEIDEFATDCIRTEHALNQVIGIKKEYGLNCREDHDCDDPYNCEVLDAHEHMRLTYGLAMNIQSAYMSNEFADGLGVR